jgi:micrococcal nuclease
VRVWSVATLLGTFALASCGAVADPSAPPRVVEVVDGDTVVVRIGGHDETARLIGVDTPETEHPSKPVECYGPEASAFTHGVLPRGTEVRVERDREARDHFGRLLVYVHRSSDDAFVNLELVRRGYARTLAIAPNTAYAADFDRAAREAREQRRGLWAACPAPADAG